MKKQYDYIEGQTIEVKTDVNGSISFEITTMLGDTYPVTLSSEDASELVEELSEELLPWRPIETAPTDTKTMFVVIALGVKPVGTFPYDSDPYCVWHHDGVFVRWPHDFPPTHWLPLPPKTRKK